MVQKVIIDVRGQTHTNAQLDKIANKIEQLSNGVISEENIEFIGVNK